MALSGIIAEIDVQIAKLQQARSLLAGTSTSLPGRGRPRGSKNVTVAAASAKPKTKRKLSSEGRKRIAEAMKKRWAEHRKQLAKG